jgi:hypothetical protein
VATATKATNATKAAPAKAKKVTAAKPKPKAPAKKVAPKIVDPTLVTLASCPECGSSNLWETYNSTETHFWDDLTDKSYHDSGFQSGEAIEGGCSDCQWEALGADWRQLLKPIEHSTVDVEMWDQSDRW